MLPYNGQWAALRRKSTAKYLLQDEFHSALATGSVDGTPAVQGPGIRTATDSENKLSISGGKLSFAPKASPSFGDPKMRYESIPRVVGRMLIVGNLNIIDVTKQMQLGITSGSSGGYVNLGLTIGTSQIDIAGGAGKIVPSISNDTDYSLVIVMRSTGIFVFIKGGTYVNWTLVWPGVLVSTDPLFPQWQNNSMTATFEYWRIPRELWLPRPIVSDSFSQADTTLNGELTDGLAHAEANGGAGRVWTDDGGWDVSSNTIDNARLELGADIITNGDFDTDSDWNKGTGWTIGSGVATKAPGVGSNLDQASILTIGTWYEATWTITAYTAGVFALRFGNSGAQGPDREETGTFIETNHADATALRIVGFNTADGAIDNVIVKKLTFDELISSIETIVADVIVSADLTLIPGTQIGIILDLDSAATPANFMLAFHNGIDIHLDKFVAGSETELIKIASTYVAGAKILVIKDNTSYTLYYNNALVGSVQTVSDGGIINNTIHGVFSTDTRNSIDNFEVWDRKNNYSKLDTWSEDRR